MAEQFALKGVENNPAQQAASVNEALFSDAYDTSKCRNGGPGVKCGAPPALPSVELSPANDTNHGPQNNYPGVFYDLASISPRNGPRSHKEIEKQQLASVSEAENKPLEKHHPQPKEKPELKDQTELKEKPHLKERPALAVLQ